MYWLYILNWKYFSQLLLNSIFTWYKIWLKVELRIYSLGTNLHYKCSSKGVSWLVCVHFKQKKKKKREINKPNPTEKQLINETSWVIPTFLLLIIFSRSMRTWWLMCAHFHILQTFWMHLLTLAHRSFRRFCPSLSGRLVFCSPLRTGRWCRALTQWYNPRNSTRCAGVQKWGIRSWRGKKYLAVSRETQAAMGERVWKGADVVQHKTQECSESQEQH